MPQCKSCSTIFEISKYASKKVFCSPICRRKFRASSNRAKGLCGCGRERVDNQSKCISCLNSGRTANWRNQLQLVGMSIEKYNTMLAAQGGTCAICHKPPVKHRLAVDHNHKTNKIRGLLCVPCNVRVAYIETTTPKLFEAIQNYLAQNSDTA